MQSISIQQESKFNAKKADQPVGYKEISSINNALVYEPKCGRGEMRGFSQWVRLYTGAQINFGNLIPYLTYEINATRKQIQCKANQRNAGELAATPG